MILQLVTSRSRLSGAGASERDAHRCVLVQVRHAVEAGIEYVQIREPGLEAAGLLALSSDAVKLAAGSRTRVLVNDRLDIALAAGAAGVHLREDSFAPAAVRAAVPSGFVIGRSVHDVAGARAAAGAADYLIAGTMWPSRSKRDSSSLLGLEGLAAIVAAVRVPVLAIGGVTIDRLPAIARTGAAGIAAIDLFLDPSADEAAGCRAVALTALVEAARARFDTPRIAS